ncbi:extra-large guanine nucleotide-binding protein 3 [Hordeum vulgare]|nr:extra-large guanine nucleotide-binding protein 3 [Hordeum vulgare]
MAEAEAADGGSWQEMMRRILPPGAPVPENLDYSIALVYDGPPVPYDLPRVDPVEIPTEIPTAESASGPHTRGLPVAPVVEPVRLPVSRIARCAEPAAAARQGSDGSSGSVNSVLQNEELDDEDDDSRSRSHGSAQSSPGPGSRDGRRAPVVTFGFTPDNKYVGSGDDMSEQYVAVTKQEKRRRRRRMACNRCGKRKWESKEACIVCDARYCGYFVLRMMGWMPEGRKCVTCIGEPLALWLLCADPLVNEFDQIISSSAFKDVHSNTVIFGIHTSTVGQNINRAVHLSFIARFVDQTQLDCAKSSMKSPISANLESKASATEDMGRQLLAFVERNQPQSVQYWQHEEAGMVTRRGEEEVNGKQVSIMGSGYEEDIGKMIFWVLISPMLVG